TGVLLLPGSRLTVTEGYGSARRDVQLIGEARFVVQRDAARPFRVTAGEAVITDLGAQFTVRTGNAGDVEVAVTAGSVLLGHAAARPGQGVTLNAGERGTLSRDGRASVDQAR